MSKYKPFNFKAWIDENRHLLKPPVGAKTLFEESDSFMIFVVGGPNRRRDFHYNETEEFFYQIEGNMKIKIREDDGSYVDVPVNEGELFLLPAKVLHSPQRGANTVGLVVEVKRPGTLDAVFWYCDNCGEELHKATYQFDQIGTELTPVLEAVHTSDEMRTCKNCGDLLVI
ncbi:MAG: 3-hydroxyanthranilate 3,4-dioxygenase [Candidatus Promineifilaceae bacterium]